MMKTVLGLFLAFLISAFAAGAALSADEFIKSYHADITIADNGELTVTETITAQSAARDIRHGIFRDFPLYRKDQNGRTYKVGFELLSVTRDGRPEPFHTEGISGGIRIYAGDAGVWLNPGDYTYTFRYTTSRQIVFYDDQDELYWNVTGNGWLFPMEKVSATVHLPGGARPSGTAFFTGYAGESGKNAEVEISGSTVEFSTIRPLAVGEGLTILVDLPKGVLVPPSSSETFWWFIMDRLGEILGFGGLAAVLLYYFRSWSAVGRDPPPGVMVPRWDAPDGISPALVNYIDNTGFGGAGWTALSASAIDLAVKGYIQLDDLDKAVVMRRTAKPLAEKLPAGQASLLSAIGAEGDDLTIDKANGRRVQSVGQQFRNAIEKEHRGTYFKSNAGYTVGGIALSLALLALMIVFGGVTEDLVPFMFIAGVIAILSGAIAPVFGRILKPGTPLLARIMSALGFGMLAFFVLTIGGGVLLSFAADLIEHDQLPILVAFGGILFVNVLFISLMGAPTPLGRKMMDGIAGLRTYLTLAERDRMNMQGAPQMSPRHFETLLPYAVALGVEKPWSRAFESWLATAAATDADRSYQPAWYHGGSRGNIADRIGGFSSSMASTISSTIPEPKSSSGSSGGSSGGGGGGGGGGGW